MSKNKKTLIRICICAALYIAALLVTNLVPYFGQEQNSWLSIVIFAAIYLAAGYDILWKAVRNITHGQIFDENFLMTIASLGAFGIGEHVDAVAVMLLYQIGELFQSYAVGKSRKNIAALMDIRPETATLVDEKGVETEVHPSEIEIGGIFVVKAGEKLALDGIVVKGSCNLDTAAITGESALRKVNVGDSVTSGCINSDGVIYVQATSTYDDSTVAKILELVENATSQKSPEENFITKFSRYYTPIVTALAVLVGVVPPLFLGIGDAEVWKTWLRAAMMFLFVSCPCALVISVPMGFFGGIAAASKRGILVKGSNYLEVLSKVDTVAFDKTGTLTKGNFSVTEVFPQNKRKEILETAALAEQYSNHPIAVSIVNEAPDVERLPCSVEETAGRGIVAHFASFTVLCGNIRLMRENGIVCNETEGGTVVYVAKNNNFVGTIVIADQLKEDSAEAVSQLKNQNCKTVLLTGDNEKTALEIARKVAIDDYYAQLYPQDKVTKVNNLKAEGRKVAFVGDGINDAPVLATADVGIAMGAMGSDAAIEAADIVLMRDNPTAIATARKISKKTLRIVKQNIAFSIGVKVAVLLLTIASSVWLFDFSMIFAILADVGVCMLAILNSMRAMILPKN